MGIAIGAAPVGLRKLMGYQSIPSFTGPFWACLVILLFIAVPQLPEAAFRIVVWLLALLILLNLGGCAAIWLDLGRIH